MKIAIVDGMGGGLGTQLIKSLRSVLGPEHEIIAIGANAVATSAMVKAGASVGATGENAVVVNVSRVDVVLGPIGIAIPHSLMGEITPRMAEAVALSPARKILVPMSQSHSHFELVGLDTRPLHNAVEQLVERVSQLAAREIKER